MAAPFDPASPRTAFSAKAVTHVVRDLRAPSIKQTRENWLRAVASLTVQTHPGTPLARALPDVLGVTPFEDGFNPLADLTIGEIGVCYEALLAMADSKSRKAAGQFFTPDDAARFMAKQSEHFPQDGVWMDPCCGVGNLAWHLAAVQADPAAFVRDRLVLVDLDETALRSAMAILAADYLDPNDANGLRALQTRSARRDFLNPRPLPAHDFVIVNPPYARAEVQPGLRTHAARELFAYFLETVATTSRGFIAVTPASYLSAPKFQVMRDVLDEYATGGRVFVFDNVPDTLFRGYKFGSSNTSSTNFVRAAITVASPEDASWQITPIIRWRSVNRSRVFALAPTLLTDRQIGPDGEWVKLPPELALMWKMLSNVETTVGDLLARGETDYHLTVGTTPRYYISAAYRDLERGSKAVLYFPTAEARDLAALALNSSIPYLWWRGLDGGVTLPKRVLRSTPVPVVPVYDEHFAALARELQETEELAITTKLNAGRQNENVKRDPELVARINEALLGEKFDMSILYTEDMAAR